MEAHGCSRIIVSVLLVSFTLRADADQVTRPNIVSILADDLGWNDVGFHGSDQIPTPNIDALAYNGVILNRHYTMPTCTPSRTAYLTGKHPIRTGMQGFPIKASEPRGLPLTEVTLPERLKDLGYATHMVGKWHQGHYRTEYTPIKRGFDSFLGYWHGFIGYISHTNDEIKNWSGLDFHRDLCPTREYEGQYATDVFTQEAVNIISRHEENRPLYLHLAHLAVHVGNPSRPLEVPDEAEAHRKFNYIASPERRLYAEMMRKLDDSVGSVVKALETRGILNNTIIIFMSDNGAQSEGFLANSGSNWPLRGLKFTLLEGGVRGVAAVWSPLFHQPGQISNQLFHLTDWLPTLYTAAGGDVSDLGDVDGVNQWESLVNYNSQNEDPRNHVLVNIDDVADIEALIFENWKIIRGSYKGGIYDKYYGDSGRGGDNPPYDIAAILNSDAYIALKSVRSSKTVISEEKILATRSKLAITCGNEVNIELPRCEKFCLFDIVADPCESVNVAEGNEDIVRVLSEALKLYREVVVSEINQDVDDRANPDLHDGMWTSWMDPPGYDPGNCTSRPVQETSYETILLTRM